jgi:putative endopeptidase
LHVSFQAFKNATEAAPLEIIDGFTPEQRFFLLTLMCGQEISVG